MQPDGTVRIAFVDLLDPRSLDAARDYFGKNIVVCITRASQLDDVLTKRKEELRIGSGTDPNRLNIVEIANSIVIAAFKRGASDIHVEPMSDRLRVRFREDGVMVHFRDYPIGAVAPWSAVSRSCAARTSPKSGGIRTDVSSSTTWACRSTCACLSTSRCMANRSSCAS